MLVYTPGRSSSTIPLRVGDSEDAGSSTSWGYIDLAGIAAAVADQAHSKPNDLHNGNETASTSGSGADSYRSINGHASTALKRSVSPEDDLTDTTAKKARTDGAYKRVLTHTFHLQPCCPTKMKKQGVDDEILYPDLLQVDLSSFPTIKYGDLDLGSLSNEGVPRDDWTLIPFDTTKLVSLLVLLLEKTDLVYLRGGRMRKVLGQAQYTGHSLPPKNVALEFNYQMDVEVFLDVSSIHDIDTAGMNKTLARQLPVAVESLLCHAFFKDRDASQVIRPIEERSNTSFKETNLEWFYSCLPRPPISGGYEASDIKGKGKARQDADEVDEVTGSRSIEPAGLAPSLHPFQCRSLEWMLYREGKVISGRDADGKHMTERIQDAERLANVRRSVMWMKIHFDDSQEWWFCPTSLEFSRSDPAEQDSESAEGSILAEEMGLGKTVEILSLILLSQEPERNLLPVYDSKRLAADVQPSGLTLLVCPQAIIGQWADEITRHAPSLRVLRYSGMKSTYPKEDGREIERTIKRFDIVLCDFDTMAADLNIAKKPHLHHTRAQVARGGRVAYRRSVLIGIKWLRVILDEAQMAASTTSAISETASWIPRKYSWAVSGTPIKQTIKDLAGLLRFLRVYDVGRRNAAFQKLLQPDMADVFSNLVSRLGVRTVKSQIEGELTLPPQERFVIPVGFSPVEAFNYRARYGEALAELQIHMDATRLSEDWAINRRLMSRWLHTLRQACFHAQMAAPVRARANNARQQEEVMVQTLDEILLDLRSKNIAELHTDQKNVAAAQVKRAYRIMYDKEDCERYENGLKVLRFAKRDLHLLAQDIYNELLLVFPEARSATSGSRSNSTTPAPGITGHPYLTVFRDTVRDIVESRNAKDVTVKAKNTTRLIGALTLRLREVLFVMHQAVFFTGNAYFNMGDKEEDETAAYAEAEALRKQILHSDEKEAMKEVTRMQSRLRDKGIRENDLKFGPPDSKGGLQSRGVFETIGLLSDRANGIAVLMFRWRQYVIDALLSSLTDQEIADTEYQAKAEMQEKLDIYIEYLGRIQADWVQLLTGTKSALSENPTLGGGANQVEGPSNSQDGPSVFEELAEAGMSKRSKRKREMNANNRKVIIAAADPATKLRGELEEERKKVVPSFILKPKKKTTTTTRNHASLQESDMDEDDFDADTSLRAQLRELGRLKENVLKEVEQAIIASESSRLRKDLAAKDKLIEQLRAEQNLFADVYNARVKFFRVMQEFGDSVAVLSDEEATPGALREEIARLKQREVDLDHGMLPKIARRRYLDGLKDANLTEEGCLICANTEQGQMVLTHCGHCMHEDCLRTWCFRSGSRTCPVCRASLDREKAWRKIQVEGEMTLDSKRSGDTDGGTLAVKSDASSAQLPALGAATMQIDDVEEVNPDDPARQLNFLPAEEIEAILDMPLAGASLGTKLDAIVKHVKLLRERHQTQIEKYDEVITQSQRSDHRVSAVHSNHSNPNSKQAPVEAKILIYSAWQYACDILAAAFRRERIGFVRLESGAKKEKAPLEFKENPDCAVFILHAKSQAAGLTLTAASYVFLVEPLLEPALETQAIARVHRIGQKKKTTVFQYIIPETVDERIALLSLRKWKHLIFSKAHSTGTVQESSIASSLSKDQISSRTKRARREIEEHRAMEADAKGMNIDGDALSDDDLARLLLDKDGMASLRTITEQVARLKQERDQNLLRQREERQRLHLQIMHANADNPAALADWDEWDLGEEVEDWADIV